MRESPMRPDHAGAIAVAVSNTQGDMPIGSDRIAAVVRLVLAEEGVRGGEVSIAVVNDASVRVINARHLGHDWATDVVSFLFDDASEGEIEGELIISADMARNQANLRGISPESEFLLYLVHGLLHLCGYDDRDEVSVAAMRRREDEVLRNLGVVNPFRSDELAAPPPSESMRGGVRWPR